MNITVPGFPASFLPPGIFMFALYGGGSAATGARQRKHVLVGNMLAAAVTDGGGASPAFTVAAGTRGTNALTFVASPDDAKTYFGQGSELHRAAVAFFAQHPAGTLYAIATPETSGAGGAKASGTITFATNATGSAIFRLYLAGETIEVSLSGSTASPVTPTAFALAVATAICARPDLPVTAQSALGVVTITAKHMGVRGNALEFAAEWVYGTTTTALTASATASGTGMTGALSAATGVLASGAAGATAEDITSALALLETDQWRIACAPSDSTNLATLDSWLDSQAGVLVQYRNQAIVCSRASVGTAAALAVARNSERLQMPWHYVSPTPEFEVAAQVMAARSIGDSYAGGVLVGEEGDPAANLDGLRLKTVKAQRSAADAPTLTEQNTAMGSGLSPLIPVAGGGVALLSSVTTRSRDAGGQPNYAVLQTSIVTSIDYVADECRRAFAADFAGFKLTADQDRPLQTDRTTTPKLVRAWLKARLKEHEAVAILRDVDALDGSLQVIEDTGTPGRLLAEIPAKVVAGLHQLAGNVRQAS